MKNKGLPFFQPEFQKPETSWKESIKERMTEHLLDEQSALWHFSPWILWVAPRG